MQYRIAAHKCKVGGMIDLKDDIIPVGSILIGEDLFIICLDPLEERKLSEEEPSKEEPSGD